MTTQVLHPLAGAYVQRLRAAARRLARSRREELIADIEMHLAEAIGPQASDAEALTVLDRLGTPEEIVAAELPEPAAPVDARGMQEWSAIILLLLGGFIFGIGWIAGLILLWGSRCWNTWEKLLGTLVVPGGWAALPVVAILMGRVEHCGLHCTTDTSMLAQTFDLVVLAIVLLGPPATAIFLARRAKTPPTLRHLT